MRVILKILRGALLAALGVGLGVTLLEVGVRLIGARPATYLRKFSSYDPMLGWVKTANMEGYFRKGDRMIHEKINSRGLRDSEYPYEKPDNVYRILVIGDSFTEGYDVEITDNFTEILERRLNDSLESELTFEVINAGTGGYSTDQEFLYYREEGCRYSPNLVILMMYPANDIYYNIKSRYGNYEKPLFMIHNDSLALSNYPLSEPRRTESLKSFFRDLALYPLITNLILTNFPTFSAWLQRIGLVSESTLEASTAGSLSVRKYPRSFGVYERQLDAQTDSAWVLTSRLLKALGNITRQNGSELLVCTIPDKFEIYTESWSHTQMNYNVNDDVWDRGKPARTIDSIASAHGLQHLNLAEPFRKHPPSTPLYNGVHWNEAGNQLAAAILFDYLKQSDQIR